MKLWLSGCLLAGCGLSVAAYGQSSTVNATAPVAAAVPANVPANTSGSNEQAGSTAASVAKQDTAGVTMGGPVKADALHDERKAAKLYLEGVKRMQKQRFEEAWKLLKQAAELEPANGTYVRAAELARESTVTQKVQQASRARTHGDATEADALIREAAEIDPKNPIAAQHLNEVADAAASEPSGTSVNEAGAEESNAASAVVLEPSKEKHSFHLHTNSRQALEEVYKAYGLIPMLHESVQSKQVRFDVDDVQFADAVRVLGMVTKTFYEPLDPHRVVIAQDTKENRQQLQRTEMETIYLPGLDDKQLTEVSNIAHNVFEVQQATPEPTRSTLTVRAPVGTLKAFNRTVDGLESGQNQIDLNIKIIQLSYISARETGTQAFQQTSLYNAYAELNSIIQQNQSAVQEIISQGLVPNASGVANQIEIVAILLAAGQLSGSVFNQGFALFGGGLTESILQPSTASLTMSLTSSDTHMLDDIHMRLSDEEPGTFKIGEKYPIETASYSSSVLPSSTALTSAETAALNSQTIPQVEYEDIGLTVKATPKMMRSNDVALTMDMKLVSLGGTSLNDIPILNNQQFSGVLTLKAGETAVLLSDLSKQESRALSGLPGISDIPGLEDISDIARDKNVARLLIIVTPSVVRAPRAAGHGPRLPVDKASTAH